MKQPVRIAITGAAGQISYSLLFRIASGDFLGKDQPVILQLLEIEPAMTALKGVIMELDDCAFPLVQSIIATSDPLVAFKDIDYGFLVGSRPRSKGMERKDLLEVNGGIFTVQGEALAKVAKKDVKVIVVGNPANTNALIALKNASGLSAKNITAMMRLDHNRAISQLATKTGKHGTQVEHVVVWGNHSATQYPDVSYATVAGTPATKLVDKEWLSSYFVPTVQKRGAAIIEARGLSSAASAASAAIDHMHDWVFGTPEGKWVTMGILSDGSYGVPKDIMFGFPVTCKNGEFHIVQGLELSEETKAGIANTAKELMEERDGVKHLI